MRVDPTTRFVQGLRWYGDHFWDCNWMLAGAFAGWFLLLIAFALVESITCKPKEGNE